MMSIVSSERINGTFASSCDSEAPRDPDPFTIVNLCFQAATFVLQLIQVRLQFAGNAQSGLGAESVRSTRLNVLHEAVLDFESSRDKTIRIIDLGCESADNQFYDAAFRVGNTLYLSASDADRLSTNLSELHTKLGAISLFLNSIIIQDPSLAARLGDRLNESLGNFLERLNRLLSEGGPNRDVLSECRRSLEALSTAIDDELGVQN